jgi:DNA-binding IclR family transcriptional regulator
MYTVPILKKAFDVLNFLVKVQTPSGVTEVSKSLGISKSTTFGILRALEREGLVAKDSTEKKYVIGPGLVDFSRRVIRGADFIAIAHPFVERLVESVDETAFVGVREHDHVKVLDEVEAKKSMKISSPVGTRQPLGAGVFGKIFLSTLDDESVMEYVKEKGLTRYTENSITDRDVYMEAVRRTRELGYAIDLEEYLKGLRAIATLIYSGSTPVAGLWIVGFSSTMSDDRLPRMIEKLKETGKNISARLSSLFVDQ